MPRAATGQVVAPGGKQRSWALRFRAYGKRRFVTLGRPEDGWDRPRAEAELRHVLADVERGIWSPRELESVQAPREAPTFHEFASTWLGNREPELAPKTIASYRWQLTDHLLPHFAGMRLEAIGAEDVDRYKAAKLREGAIGPNQINKSLGLLARILDAAGDYGHLDPSRNPARGPRRRVKRTRPSRPTMEPEQLPALLDAAREPFQSIPALLAGAGLRNGEACALNWRDLNLASGTLTVCEAKTDAGIRRVDIPLALRELLADHKARRSRVGPDDPVFSNRAGRRQTVSNVERRLKTVVRRANQRLAELGIEAISEDVTPHSLRRLYASLRFALGDDPVYVAAQLGHTEPAFSMKVYAQAVRRRERLAGSALHEFDRALHWAEMGRIEPAKPDDRPVPSNDRSPEMAQPSREPAPRPGSSVG
jgi:integrase